MAWFAGLDDGKSDTPPVAPSVMAVLYLEAQRVGTITAWEAFLEICGDSPYCELAEAARAKLVVPPNVREPPPPVVAAPVEPAPAEAEKSVPVPEPAPTASVPDTETPSAEAAAPPAVVTPKPKPQRVKAVAKPKPLPRPQPLQPDPEHTGSIPQPAPTMPGTQTQAAAPPRGLLESKSQPEPTSGLKPKSGAAAKSTREFKRSMFPHLRRGD